ncbi:MAG: hypothetical protein ACAH11_01145 [Sphingomonas sp.]
MLGRKNEKVAAPSLAGRGARRRISGYFLAMHAISAEDAVAYNPQDSERAEFERLLALNIVRQPVKGHYWIDRAALKVAEEAAERRLVPGVILACLAAAAILVLFYVG